MSDYNEGRPGNSPYEAPRESGATGSMNDMKEQISEQVSDVKSKVSDFGRKVSAKIDDSRISAASALDKTAASLDSGGEQVSGAARSAAEKIHATADYVRQTDLDGMMEDVRGIVKRYPGPSLAAAAILGFLIARGLRASN